MQQLIQQNPNRPNINLFVIPLVLENLRRHVLVRAAEGLPRGTVHRAPSKIAKLGVSETVDQDILGLDVAVDDVASVQVGHAAADLLEEGEQLGPAQVLVLAHI